MKSDTNIHRKMEVGNNVAMSDFEEFINLARNKKVSMGNDRKVKSADGKQFYQ